MGLVFPCNTSTLQLFLWHYFSLYSRNRKVWKSLILFLVCLCSYSGALLVWVQVILIRKAILSLEGFHKICKLQGVRILPLCFAPNSKVYLCISFKSASLLVCQNCAKFINMALEYFTFSAIFLITLSCQRVSKNFQF